LVDELFFLTEIPCVLFSEPRLGQCYSRTLSLKFGHWLSHLLCIYASNAASENILSFCIISLKTFEVTGINRYCTAPDSCWNDDLVLGSYVLIIVTLMIEVGYMLWL
jgi:hypothetical protein